jgi:AraC-like DNA-binding protein
MRTLLSTDDVAAKERASYWIDLICDVFVQLDCTDVAPDFYGKIVNEPLGRLQLSEVAANKQLVKRSRRQLSRSNDDCFLISLQLAGQGVVQQDGRSAALAPGDFALYDSTRSYTLGFQEDFRQLVLKAPRSLLTERLDFPERCTATRIAGSGGMGRVASELLRAVAREAPTLLPHEIERMSHTLIDVFAAAFGHSLVGQPLSATSHCAAQLVRIKMFIEDHLRDPELSPEKIAAAHGISTRYLSKLFESTDSSVARCIWERRLERIARDLRDPDLAAHSVSEIAFGWGYNNMSHFSRAFKLRFGVSPRAHRTERKDS